MNILYQKKLKYLLILLIALFFLIGLIITNSFNGGAMEKFSGLQNSKSTLERLKAFINKEILVDYRKGIASKT